MEKLSHTGLKDIMDVFGKDDSGGFGQHWRDDSDKGLAGRWQGVGESFGLDETSSHQCCKGKEKELIWCQVLCALGLQIKIKYLCCQLVQVMQIDTR